MKPSALWLTGILLVLKVALPFLLTDPAFELHRDEYLYYQQGQHLAFGYLENPPLIGLLAAVSSLFGGGFFWIKFWPVLFGGLTLLVTLRMAKEFGGGLYAQALAGLGIVFSAYLRTHFLFQPNFLDIFCWSLSAYYLLRYMNTQQRRYIFLLAAALTLGWYSKYSVLFFMVAMLVSVAATPHRTLFLRRPFWVAAAAGSLFVLPNIIWQWNHNWPLVHHMKELQQTQLQHLNKTDFIKEQFLMLFPVLFLWVGGLVWLLRNHRYRVIGYTYLLIILLLMLGSGKGYYALGAYPMLLAAGGVWTERVSIRKPWLQYAFATLIMVLAFPFVPILLPAQNPAAMAAFNKKWGLADKGLLKWEDGENHPLQQDFADMLGWKEITAKAEAVFNGLPDSARAGTVVFCRNYGLAGAAKYYAQTNQFKQQVMTDNGSFLLWMPEQLSFKNIILIGRDTPAINDAVFSHFRSRQVMDSCTNTLSRQYGYKLFLFQGASDSAEVELGKAFSKERKLFER